MHAHVTVTQVARTAPSTELTVAAKQGDLELARELLRRFASPDSTDERGRAALHRAANHKRHAMVRLLLSAGAHVDRLTDDGHANTALHLAATQGDCRCVRRLLAARADAAVANAAGMTPAQLARSDECALLLRQALRETVREGGVVPSAYLVLAAAAGDAEACRRELRAGADPDSADGSLTARCEAYA